MSPQVLSRPSPDASTRAETNNGKPVQRRLTSRAITRLLVLFLLAGVGLFTVSTSVLAQDCVAGAGSDFDGDGVIDLAIGDPDATVGGAERAGRVHIAYGDGERQSITQETIADNDNAAGDRFGHALAATDWNSDGCTDLLVGVPFEDWSNNTVVDAGVIVLIPGSAEGLNTAAAQIWTQASFNASVSNETGDQLGFSLVAGELSDGTPYMLAGVPGEDLNAVVDAGLVVYRTPQATVAIHQDSAGVTGVGEVGDQFGYSIASTPTRFAIGSPGEAIGTEVRAGGVQVFTHNGAVAVPTQFGGADQDSELISGGAETGDLMGYALAMVDYRPTATTTATVLVVSAPGEDGATATEDTDTDGGWVFEFDANDTVTQRLVFDQNTPGVSGGRESGDLFGAGLAAINRTPDEVASWEDVVLAVGTPGEDVGSGPPLIDRGGVQGFSLIGAPGEHGFDPTAQLYDSAADWRSGMQLGMWLHTTVDHLIVADPLAESPTVYAVPWDAMITDTTDTTLVLTPEEFGVDPDTAGSFGSSLA